MSENQISSQISKVTFVEAPKEKKKRVTRKKKLMNADVDKQMKKVMKKEIPPMEYRQDAVSKVTLSGWEDLYRIVTGFTLLAEHLNKHPLQTIRKRGDEISDLLRRLDQMAMEARPWMTGPHSGSFTLEVRHNYWQTGDEKKKNLSLAGK